MTYTAARRITVAIAVLWSLSPARLSAQGFQVVHSFTGCPTGNCQNDQGARPKSGMVRGANGSLFGGTEGSPAYGTIYEFHVVNGFTSLWHFYPSTPPLSEFPNGLQPQKQLLFESGMLFGTTAQGGVGNDGTLFGYVPGGALTTLHDFDDGNVSSGNQATGGLARGSDGHLYGTHGGGGTNNKGRLFQLQADGTYLVVHSFNGADGERPNGDLIRASDGHIYGTTQAGGNGHGVVFRWLSTSAFEVVHIFDGIDGTAPATGVYEGADHNLYGLARGGSGSGGVAFRLSLTGTFTPLHNFPLATEGFSPLAPLMEASDGYFYGVMRSGGSDGKGLLFRMSPAGDVDVLHEFSGPDGDAPYGGLVQGDDGHLYGTTYAGGTQNLGVIYRWVISPNIPEIAWPNPTSVLEGTPLGDEQLNATTTVPGTFVYTPLEGTVLPPGVGQVLTVEFRPDDVIAYAITTTTRTIDVTPVSPPNLQVTKITAPGSAAPIATIAVTDTTRNVGIGPAPPTTTRIWLSLDNVLGSGDIALTTRPVASLGVNALSQVTTSVTLPDVSLGTYYLLVEADAEGEATESNEQDNVKFAKIVIGPDYTISALTLTPAAGMTTAPTLVSMTTRNVGAASGAASVTQLYRSVDGVIDPGDVLLATVDVAVLQPGQSSATTVPVIPPVGKYRLIARADAAGALIESLETNNERSKSLSLGPDLTVTALATVPNPPTSLSLTSISVTVRNGGTEATGAFVTRLYRSTNTTLDASDILITEFQTAALGAQASQVHSASVVLPTGTYSLIAITDEPGGVPELSESNNLRRGKVTVP